MHNKDVVLAFVVVVYFVWSSRNKVLFVDGHFSTHDITMVIKFHIYSVLQNLYPIDTLSL